MYPLARETAESLLELQSNHMTTPAMKETAVNAKSNGTAVNIADLMQRIFPKALSQGAKTCMQSNAPKIPEPPGGCQAIAKRILDRNIIAVIW
jgi:hypothetical protein